MPPKHPVKPIIAALTRKKTAPDIVEAPDGSLAPAVYSRTKPEDEEVIETRETTFHDQKKPASKLFEMDDALVFALLLCASLLIGSPLPLLLFPLFLMAKAYAKDSNSSSKETVTKTVRRHSEEKGQERALMQARDEVHSRPEIGAQATQQTQPIQLSPQIHLDAENLIKSLQDLADQMARAKNDGERRKLAQDFTRNITNNYNNIYPRGGAGKASPQTRTGIEGLLQQAGQFDGASEAERARIAPEIMERLAGLSQNQDFRRFITNIQGAASKGATHIHNTTHKHFHQTKNLSREDILRIVEQIRPLLPPAVPPAQIGERGADSHAETQGLREGIEILQREVDELKKQLEAAKKGKVMKSEGTQTNPPAGREDGGTQTNPPAAADAGTDTKDLMPPPARRGGSSDMGTGDGAGDGQPAGGDGRTGGGSPLPPVTPSGGGGAGDGQPAPAGGKPPAPATPPAPPAPAGGDTTPARPSGQQGPHPDNRGDQASASLHGVNAANINDSSVIHGVTERAIRAQKEREERARELKEAVADRRKQRDERAR